MDSRIDRLSAQFEILEKKSASGLRSQKKKLAEKRKIFPEKEEPEYHMQTGCLHSGSKFLVPVQNWKSGTPFLHHGKAAVEKNNKHSAKVMRSIPMQLNEKELDYVMSRRYKLAKEEIPVQHGIFEIVPTTTEPIHKEHKTIWKEYM